jgi:hypothetical protein
LMSPGPCAPTDVRHSRDDSRLYVPSPLTSPSPGALEVLHGTLMALGGPARRERAQISPPPGPGIAFSRVEPILAGSKFSDHHPLLGSLPRRSHCPRGPLRRFAPTDGKLPARFPASPAASETAAPGSSVVTTPTIPPPSSTTGSRPTCCRAISSMRFTNESSTTSGEGARLPVPTTTSSGAPQFDPTRAR